MASDSVSTQGEGKDRVEVQEEKREVVIRRVLSGKLAIEEAAELLGLSVRQTWRLRARYIERGPVSLAHGNRGRAPANRLPAARTGGPSD